MPKCEGFEQVPSSLERLYKNMKMKLRDFLKEKPLISSSPSAAEEPVSIHQFVPTHAQPVFSCSKLTIETLKHGVKYVQS